MKICIRYFISVYMGEESFIVGTDIPYICQESYVLDKLSFCYMIEMMGNSGFYGGLRRDFYTHLSGHNKRYFQEPRPLQEHHL